MRTADELPRRTRFGISVDQDERQVAVMLSGRLDRESCALVALWLTPFVLLEVTRPVVIDVTRLKSVHAYGLETLLGLVELAGHRRCDVRFVVADGKRELPLRLDDAPTNLIAQLVRSLPIAPS